MHPPFNVKHRSTFLLRSTFLAPEHFSAPERWSGALNFFAPRSGAHAFFFLAGALRSGALRFFAPRSGAVRLFGSAPQHWFYCFQKEINSNIKRDFILKN